MAQKNVTLRMDEAQIEKLQKDYGQISTAAQLILGPFIRLRTLTIDELKGYFSPEEWRALLNAHNGLIPSPDLVHNKTIAIAQIQDCEAFESGISSQGANLDVLVEKVSKLSNSQVYFLVMAISAYWNNDEAFLSTLFAG